MPGMDVVKNGPESPFSVQNDALPRAPRASEISAFLSKYYIKQVTPGPNKAFQCYFPSVVLFVYPGEDGGREWRKEEDSEMSQIPQPQLFHNFR